MKTFSLKAGDIQRKWYLVDGTDLVVGRAASVIAKVLRGKTDPRFTAHMDHGPCVVMINAEKVHFTSGKAEKKHYYRHTGHPGGIKHAIASELLAGRHADRVMKKAVERMLGGEGPMKRRRMENFYVYSGSEHRHHGQKPEILPIASYNPKNVKRSAS